MIIETLGYIFIAILSWYIGGMIITIVIERFTRHMEMASLGVMVSFLFVWTGLWIGGTLIFIGTRIG